MSDPKSWAGRSHTGSDLVRRAMARLEAAGHEPPPGWDGRLGRGMTPEESRAYGAYLVLVGVEIRNEASVMATPACMACLDGVCRDHDAEGRLRGSAKPEKLGDILARSAPKEPKP